MRKLFDLLAIIAMLTLACTGYAQSSDFDNNLKFTCAGPKCLGLEFSFRYPTTWKFIEPDRPHVVAKVFSEAGKGLEGVVVSVHNDPQLLEYPLKEIASSAMPKGAKLIKLEDNIGIDDCSSASIEFAYEFKKLDMENYSRNVTYIVRYKKHCIILSFMVGGKADDKDAVDERFKSFYPLFKKMALSTTILSKYN
jgi:hypothetical protein